MLTRFYQFKFEQKPPLFQLKSSREKGVLYTHRDFVVNFFEEYASYPNLDGEIVLDATVANIERFLLFAEQNIRGIKLTTKNMSVKDLLEILYIAKQVKLSGYPFFEYDGYVFHFEEAIERLNMQPPPQEENWYQYLIDFLLPYKKGENTYLKRYYHKDPPNFIQLVSADRYYIWCPTETCEVLKKTREKFINIEYSSDAVNAFVLMIFPYHEPDANPLPGDLKYADFINAVRLIKKFNFIGPTKSEEFNEIQRLLVVVERAEKKYFPDNPFRVDEGDSYDDLLNELEKRR